MIKAIGTSKSGQTTVFLGLSRTNTERLMMGQPIPVRLRNLNSNLPDIQILIFGGETEESMVEELRAAGLLPDDIQE